MPEAGLDLEHTAASVAVARRFVTRRLLDWGAQRLLDPSVLLTSEIVRSYGVVLLVIVVAVPALLLVWPVS